MSQSGLKKRNFIKQELEAEADSILRADRRDQKQLSFPIDLLSERDAARRDRRRRELATCNVVLLEVFHSSASARSTEELLIARQDQAHAAASLIQILQRFENDKSVKTVVVTAILGDISFFRTSQLAEACQMREDILRAAKERLKYFTRKNLRLVTVA